MKAIDAARALCRLAENEAADGEDRLTNMRVQKLLYYCQGWSMAERGGVLFDEPIEAWVHGPVVRSVYTTLKAYGSNLIDPQVLGDYEGEPSDDEIGFVEKVWNTYKDYSTTSLREMTHKESPWRDARKGLPDDASSGQKITTESMRYFFTSLNNG